MRHMKIQVSSLKRPKIYIKVPTNHFRNLVKIRHATGSSSQRVVGKHIASFNTGIHVLELLPKWFHLPMQFFRCHLLEVSSLEECHRLAVSSCFREFCKFLHRKWPSRFCYFICLIILFLISIFIIYGKKKAEECMQPACC